MAKSRSTFGRREREIAKKAKAASKRERRQSRPDAESTDDEPTAAPAEVDQSKVLAELAELHRRYDDEQISFEDFEKRRDELMGMLEVE